jgi:hypothetical protein
LNCLNPSACKSKGFGLLCRSCNARRVGAGSHDALTEDQRKQVAQYIVNNPAKSYWVIADEWLTDASQISRIAKRFGVSRRQHDRHS